VENDVGASQQQQQQQQRHDGAGAERGDAAAGAWALAIWNFRADRGGGGQRLYKATGKQKHSPTHFFISSHLCPVLKF
jgi:hypothetical protein